MENHEWKGYEVTDPRVKWTYTQETVQPFTNVMLSGNHY